MTSIKKIALAMVAAMTTATLVAAPANAAPTIANTTMYDTTNGVQVISGLATVTLTTDTSTVTNVVVTGIGNIVIASAGTNTTLSVPVQTSGWYQVTTDANGPGTSTLMITSAVAGVTTITATPINSNGTQGTPVVKTVTWTSTGSLAPSAAYSTVYSALGTAAPDATTNATALVGPMTAQSASANAVAHILVALKDGNNNAISNGTLTVTVSGPGMIGIGSSQSAATATGRALTGSAGAYHVNVFGDGTPGVGTITIWSGTTLLGSKTVTFSGPAASYAATNVTKVLKVGSNAGAVTVTVKDASGNLVANGTTVYASVDSTTVATVAASATTTDGVATFAVQGIAAGSANITFKNNPTTATVSATSAVRVGASTASSVIVSFDKADYVNGEAVKLTLKALDAAGLPIADGTYTNLLTEDLVSSTQLGGATLVGSKSPALVNGEATWNIYAPLSAGPFSVSGKVTANSVAVSASATVGNPTAKATEEAVAAAKAATDAANAAAEAASQATAQAEAANAAIAKLSADVASLIASIKKQIASLTALVVKIQKKVRA